MKHITFTKTLGIVGLLCVLLVLYYGSIFWIIASLLYYKIVVGLLGNQIAQHRYFSHNSFKTTKAKKFFLYFVSLTTGVNPFNYSLSHRHHHVHSDKPGDIHSPNNSIWDIFSPVTYKSSSTTPMKIARVLDSDLMPFYKWHVYTIMTVLILSLIISWKFCLFILLAGVGWNYIHMILFRVFLSHVKLPGSYKNYEDAGDNSYNNKFLVYIDIGGEGLHNNHHALPNRYNQATHPGEFDTAAWVVDKFFIHTNYGDHSVKV